MARTQGIARQYRTAPPDVVESIPCETDFSRLAGVMPLEINGRRRPNIGTMKLLHVSLIVPAPLLGAGCSAYDPPVESDRTSEKYKADVVVVAATAAGLAIGYIWFSPIAMPAPAEVGSGRTSLAASAASPRIGATGGGEADHPPRRTKRTWILCSVPMQFTSHT